MSSASYSYDFGARILSSGAWTTPDPLAEKFYPLSPYTFCASDPINHVDRDGKEWEVYVDNTENGMDIKLNIKGVLVNASSTLYDMNVVAAKIKEQLEEVYTFTSENLNVSMTADIRFVESLQDISFTDHIFTIVNQEELRPNVLGHAIGNGIELGTKLIDNVLKDENFRTIAHEVGHTGFLHDTNKERNNLPIQHGEINLMTQIVALDKYTDKNSAILLEPIQINEIVNNYMTGRLNLFNPLVYKYRQHIYP